MKAIHSIWSLLIFFFIYKYLDNQLLNHFLLEVGMEDEMKAGNVMLFTLEILLFAYLLVFGKKNMDKIQVSMLSLLFGILITSFGGATQSGNLTFPFFFPIVLPIIILFFINTWSYKVRDKYIILTISALCILLSVRYFYYYNFISLSLTHDFINNGSYIILLFLPIVLCIENNIIKNIILSFIGAVVLSSAKRLGIISLGLSLLVYFSMLQFSKKNLKQFLLYTFIFSIAVFIALYMYEKINVMSDNLLSDRMNSLFEDQGSGRDEVYSITFNMIVDSDFLSLLFGHGWNSVVRYSRINLSAHNDFLEILFDFGVIVLFFYLYFYVLAIKKFFRMKRQYSRYIGPYATLLIIFFLLSMGSHIIIYPSVLIISIMDFVIITNLDKKHLSLNENRNISIPVGY